MKSDGPWREAPSSTVRGPCPLRAQSQPRNPWVGAHGRMVPWAASGGNVSDHWPLCLSQVLHLQLESLGLNSRPIADRFVESFKAMWSLNGHSLSKMFTGSRALEGKAKVGPGPWGWWAGGGPRGPLSWLSVCLSVVWLVAGGQVEGRGPVRVSHDPVQLLRWGEAGGHQAAAGWGCLQRGVCGQREDAAGQPGPAGWGAPAHLELGGVVCFWLPCHPEGMRRVQPAWLPSHTPRWHVAGSPWASELLCSESDPWPQLDPSHGLTMWPAAVFCVRCSARCSCKRRLRRGSGEHSHFPRKSWRCRARPHREPQGGQKAEGHLSHGCYWGFHRKSWAE